VRVEEEQVSRINSQFNLSRETHLGTSASAIMQPQEDHRNFDDNERWDLLRPKYRAEIAREAHQPHANSLEPRIVGMGIVPRNGMGRVEQLGVICLPPDMAPITLIAGGMIGSALFGVGTYAAFRAAFKESSFFPVLGLLVGGFTLAIFSVNSIAAIVAGIAKAAGGGLPSVQRENSPAAPAAAAASSFTSDEPIPPA
jgi:hypothetical protein